MKCLSEPPTLIRIWELSLPSVLSASVNKIECIAIAFCKHTVGGEGEDGVETEIGEVGERERRWGVSRISTLNYYFFLC